VLDADTVTTAPLKTSPDDDPVGRSDHRIPYEGSEIDAGVTSRTRIARRPPETVVRQDAGRALWRAPEKHDRVEQRECRQRIPEELDPGFAIWPDLHPATLRLDTDRYSFIADSGTS
jgi:hypothetical protein